MGPQKTMAISQAQQQQQQSAGQQIGGARQVKSKARKSAAKQQTDSRQTQQVEPKEIAGAALQANAQANVLLAPAKNTIQSAPVVPSERTTIKRKQLEQQVPTKPVKEQTGATKRNTNTVSVIATAAPATTTITINPLLGKQLSEEADDTDAGIELDGSSNSGSSVKDINEDSIKSTSVSPVMAQSNLVNETNAKQAVEVAPIEQLAGAICSAPNPSAKRVSATKQQLAANQQVIDADEQLLTERLQSKQCKPAGDSFKGSSVTLVSAANLDGSARQSGTTVAPAATAATTPNGAAKSTAANNLDKALRMRRKFSSQSSQESQDGSNLCKVCEQHVYQMERMLAEKFLYHKKCFRCHQCKSQLRVDNYSSHEGQVYCKAHHRQLFQPQVKLDNEDDVDIVAKSTSEPAKDDYLLHRGRLSELSFSFLQPKVAEGILKRQMIICENEPAELPSDVVRCDTKASDGIEKLNLNLSNILQKFEKGTANKGSDDDEDDDAAAAGTSASQPSSAGIVIEKPSVNIKQTLMAFESRLANGSEETSESPKSIERPVVRKLTNLNGFLQRQSSQDETAAASNSPAAAPAVPLAVRRSESLMMRLKKYESRIAGEQVPDDDSDDDGQAGDANSTAEAGEESNVKLVDGAKKGTAAVVASEPAKLRLRSSINLSSLKSQWENGDINNRRDADDEPNEEDANGDNEGKLNGNSPLAEKNEELLRIRQQLARKKNSVGGGSNSVRNIYENAIQQKQLQEASSKRNSSDLSALNGFSSLSSIQQQLLNGSSANNNADSSQSNPRTPSTPNGSEKDHFQLNLTNKANRLKEKFELGLINNSSRDDSDASDSEQVGLSKMEQIRQEKMEDLSVFTEGEIKAREARSLFQQIDRRISAANQRPAAVNSRSLASIGASMRAKLTSNMNANSSSSNNNNNLVTVNGKQNNHHEGVATTTTTSQPQAPLKSLEKPQPIRLTNNVRT